MRNILAFLPALLSFCFPTAAQIYLPANLVPNPGFEYLLKKPKTWMSNKYVFHETISMWTSPNLGSPDVLVNAYLAFLSPSRPHVSLNGYRARTGKTMVGIKTWGCKKKVMHCKEFLQVKLKEPLQPGQKYELEFWAAALHNSVKADNLGAGFSSYFLADATAKKLNHVKPVAYFKHIVNPERNHWWPLRHTFTADSAWQYLLIGNFFPDSLTKVDNSDSDIPYSYYFIDDVSLRKINAMENPNPDSIAGMYIMMDAVHFEYDKAELLPNSYAQLLDLAHWLKKNPQIKLEIAGHTDNIANEAYNRNLSLKRAQAVADFLISTGTNPKRLTVRGFGKTRPIAPNDNEEGRQKNRRVEFKIL